MLLQEHERRRNAHPDIVSGSLMDDLREIPAYGTVLVGLVVLRKHLLREQRLERGLEHVAPADKGGGDHAQDVAALQIGKVRGVSEVDDRQAVPVCHYVAGMEIPMVEPISEKPLVHPLLREIDEKTLPLERFVVQLGQPLAQCRDLRDRAQDIVSVLLLQSGNQFGESVLRIPDIPVVRHTGGLLQDETVHRRRSQGMHLHGMQRCHDKGFHLAAGHETSLAKICRLLIHAAAEIDVRGLEREVELLHYAGELSGKRLCHAIHTCGRGLEYLAFAGNGRLDRRTEELHHAFLPFRMLVGEHPAQERLPHRRRPERTHHGHGVDASVRTLDYARHARLDVLLGAFPLRLLEANHI